jgi:hypothetical protein
MSTTITRVYESSKNAADAVSELKKQGFGDISLVSKGGEVSDVVESTAPVTADAKAFAKSVSRGGALVTVRAPFGTAAKAIGILESFGPIESPAGRSEYYSKDGSNPTPLSSALGLPVLVKSDKSSAVLLGDTSGFSTWLGIPAVIKGAKPSATLWNGSLSASFGIPEISKDDAPKAERKSAR